VIKVNVSGSDNNNNSNSFVRVVLWDDRFIDSSLVQNINSPSYLSISGDLTSHALQLVRDADHNFAFSTEV
jgi:hypothetical protein